ncbi:MAG: glycosyltransferase family 4 protein [Phycisphaerales bacterium]
MRVAYVCADPGVPVFGKKGCSVHAQEVIRSLRGRGANVELFARRLGGGPPPGLQAVPVHRLPPTAKGNAVVKEQSALDANHDLHTALATTGTYDLIYERHSLWAYAGMEYALECGIPGLLEVNAPLIEEQRRYRHLALPRDAERAVARAFGAASALLCVSERVAEYANSHPTATGRVYVVPNGVDPDRITPHQDPALPAESDVFTVGFVGTLKPWHGVDSLIGAFADLHRVDPRVRLLIVGDGPQSRELQAAVQARGMKEAVVFVGPVEPAKIPAILTSMDVAVAPYPALANFYFSPLKILEYMAAGRAIVASAAGQINELIAHGRTGLLCPPGDSAELAAALHRLKADAPLRRRLGKAARCDAVRNHTWDAVACRIVEIAQTRPSDQTIHQKV